MTRRTLVVLTAVIAVSLFAAAGMWFTSKDADKKAGAALADNVKQAQQRVYDVARGIYFDGAQYRRDIGHRAVKGG